MRWERLGRKVALDVALGINYLHTRYVTTGCLRPIVPVVLMFYYAHGALLSCMGSASAASLVPVIRLFHPALSHSTLQLSYEPT